MLVRCRLQKRTHPSWRTWCTRGKAVAPRCRPRSPPVDAVARMTAEGWRQAPELPATMLLAEISGALWLCGRQRLTCSSVGACCVCSARRCWPPRPPRPAADRLPAPKGEVILTVRGRIAATNDGDRALLDRDLLLAWGTDELRTTTPFTDGVEHLLRRARLAAARRPGRRRHATADPRAQRLRGRHPDRGAARATRSSWRWTATASRSRCASAARSG